MELGSILRLAAIVSVAACNHSVDDRSVDFRSGLSALTPAAANLTNPVWIKNLDDYQCARVGGWGRLVREDYCSSSLRQKFVLEQYHSFEYFRIKRGSYCMTVQPEVGGVRELKTDHCGLGNPADELFKFEKATAAPNGVVAELHSLVAVDQCLEGGATDDLLRVKPCDGSSGQTFSVQEFGVYGGGTDGETEGGSWGEADSSGGTGDPPPPPPPPAEPGPCPKGEDCCLGDPAECIVCMPTEIGCP